MTVHAKFSWQHITYDDCLFEAPYFFIEMIFFATVLFGGCSCTFICHFSILNYIIYSDSIFPPRKFISSVLSFLLLITKKFYIARALNRKLIDLYIQTIFALRCRVKYLWHTVAASLAVLLCCKYIGFAKWTFYIVMGYSSNNNTKLCVYKIE